MNFFVEGAIASWRKAGVQREADDGVARISKDDALGFGFGAAINGQWIDWVGFGVVASGAVEDEVRRKENQWYVTGEFAEALRELDVCFVRQLRLLLASRRFAECGTMHYQSG